VKSQGKGQSFEIQASRSKSSAGSRPAHLPDPAQAALAGVPARSRAPAPAHQPVRRGHPHPQLPGPGRAPFFHENGFNWISTPIITTSDAEGAGEMFRVSTSTW
jgi:asparaginyl-tRNA synthetase